MIIKVFLIYGSMLNFKSERRRRWKETKIATRKQKKKSFIVHLFHTQRHTKEINKGRESEDFSMSYTYCRYITLASKKYMKINKIHRMLYCCRKKYKRIQFNWANFLIQKFIFNFITIEGSNNEITFNGNEQNWNFLLFFSKTFFWKKNCIHQQKKWRKLLAE